TRQAAYIDNQLDPVLLNQRNEVVDFACGMANRPEYHMNRKRLFALAAILLMIGIAVPFAIGWALAAPVQISVGNAPSDLSAQPVEFKSESGAIVKSWWCPTVNSRGVVLIMS